MPIPESFGFDTYLSPFTFKYGSPEMRTNWSQQQFWQNDFDVVFATASAQHQAGLVSSEELAKLATARDHISVARILNLEREIGHDQIAFYTHLQDLTGCDVIGNGLTSEDGLSNAEMMQISGGFGILRNKLVSTIKSIAEQVETNRDLVCMGYTHLQAAEPTTMGYRFARYAQNLLVDLRTLDHTLPELKGKGVKGPVGTSASLENILEGSEMTVQEHEDLIMKTIAIPYATITDQTYPRRFLFDTLKVLAGTGLSLHHAALEIQILQSSNFDEVSEPRRKGQPGSAAMPHKQNPIITENIDSITEELPGHLISAWMTGAFQTLERTLRDSAGKRSWLPESFLIVDEALTKTEKVFKGLRVHKNSVRYNLGKHAPFCATEIILGKLVDAGVNRLGAHQILHDHSETAKEDVRSGLPNPFRTILLDDERITGPLGKDVVEKAFDDIYHHVGRAPQACVDFLEKEVYPAIHQQTA